MSLSLFPKNVLRAKETKGDKKVVWCVKEGRARARDKGCGQSARERQNSRRSKQNWRVKEDEMSKRKKILSLTPKFYDGGVDLTNETHTNCPQTPHLTCLNKNAKKLPLISSHSVCSCFSRSTYVEGRDGRRCENEDSVGWNLNTKDFETRFFKFVHASARTAVCSRWH